MYCVVWSVSILRVATCKVTGVIRNRRSGKSGFEVKAIDIIEVDDYCNYYSVQN